MEYVTLGRSKKYDGYFCEQYSDIAITHLALYLTSDVGCHANKFYKKWLNNPEDTEGGGNYSHLEKQDNKVVISFNYDWFYETLEAPILELSIEQLNYILDRWQEACEKQPNKIIIIRDDDGKVTVDFED